MKLFKLLVITSFFLNMGCFEDYDDKLVLNKSVNDFIWKGMNSWYYWQEQVSDLVDTKDDNNTEYNTYLNKFTTHKDFFESLKFQPNMADRFSWFVEDYVAQSQLFQGISKSHGLRYKPVQINNNGDVIFYVQYVASNSPASTANIKRGDIINAIDGTVLNTSNFADLANKLFNETIKLSFVSVSNNVLMPKEDKTLTASVLLENPVHLKKVFSDINGKKVGYLVYNGFRTSYNDELNEAFAFFKAENIDELILDLRLNGGGSVPTSAYLSSMICASAETGKFAILQYNSKHSKRNGFFNFQNTLNVFNANNEKVGEETINRLSTLKRLYVLTSKNTASASEMVINGLKPYMSEIKIIGETTYGKNVGSITLYDSPLTDYLDVSSANPTHSYALQPIVFKIFNKNGESDYAQGFAPNIEVKEAQFWNNILPFGDENEVVLKAALNDVKGGGKKGAKIKKAPFSKDLTTKVLDDRKFEKEMFLDYSFFERQ